MSTVSVNVYQNNSLIAQANNRPRRNTPKGITGIVYQGLVYPVFNGTDRGLYINIDSESYDRSECPSCPARQKSNWGQKSIGVESTAHYVETNQFGHYFVFNGSHELFESIDFFSQSASHLLPFISSGESFRPANNGFQYDWYIRFDLKCDPEKIPVHLLQAIDDFYERAQSIVLNDYMLAEAEPKTSELSRLEERFEGIEAKVEILNDELDRKDQQLDDERKKQSQLNAEIKKLKLALNAYESGEESKSGKILEYDEYLNDIAIENQKLKADKDKVDDVNKLLIAQKAQLEKELFNSPSVNGSKALKKKVYDFCSAYLEQLDRVFLDPDSIDTMLSRFSDYSHLLQILQDINDGKNVVARSIQGRGNRQPLYEVTAHIRTGIAGITNMGRIYYKRRADEDGFEVFLQIKRDNADQRRFISSIS
ncbi:hypothetical protein N8087_04935 [Porticoccaceae bacterium]|nr:hypothetical protein [Porticoccaceae bacterium]